MVAHLKLKKNVENTEVKFVLNSDLALQKDFTLTDDIISFFSIDHPSQQMKVWYLDTKNQSLNNDDWIIRYRYHDDCDFELTYKKRCSEAQYKAIIDTQLGDSFSKQFKPEIDMGFSKETYSLSYMKYFTMNDDFYNLDIFEATRLAIVNSPRVFCDWNGKNEGYKKLFSSVLYGPVSAVEYKGKFEDIEIRFEIWKLDEYFCELSFDIKTDKSEKTHENMLSILQKKRLVKRENTLKTKALFDYYKNHKELLAGD